jgi:hypothetical protein
MPHASLGKFLRAIEPVLAAFYSVAAELPDVVPDTEDVPESSRPEDEYRELQGSLYALLGRFDSYQEIFDPSDVEDREPVQYLLSLDLVEILEDLDYGRSLTAPTRHITPADILWQWRFGFTTHWGRHATTALRVINSVLHTQFVQALEKRGRMPNKRLKLAARVD